MAVLGALSPQRRRFVLGAGLVVMLLVAALVVRAVVSGGAVTAADQSRPGPVVLVPGYGGKAETLDTLAARLRLAGRVVTIVALPDGGTGDLGQQADSVQQVVSQALASGAPSVDVVGFSAGGVVVRLWASEGSHAGEARRIVSIGGPQHGTSVADAAGLLLGAGCTGGCSQLQAGSSLLDGLNSGDETPNGPEWVSLWTTVDQTIVPPASSSLAGADDIPLQSVCPSDRSGHSEQVQDPLTLGLVVAALGTGPLPHPTTADCARYSALGRG